MPPERVEGKVKAEIKIAPELWASSVLPEGMIEAWLMPAGSYVEGGKPVATIRIEDALHEIVAPASGRLRTDLAANSVVDPGTVIGRIES